MDGWCLSEYEGGVGFLAGGKRPQIERLALPSPGLARVFPFFQSAGRSAFGLGVRLGSEERATGLIDVALCDRVIGDPLNPWHTTYIPLTESPFRMLDSYSERRVIPAYLGTLPMVSPLRCVSNLF